MSPIHRLPTPRTRLIGSWMLAEPGREIGFHGQSRLIPRWLQLRSEPMLWGSTPEGMQTMLKGSGWCDAQLIDLARLEVVSADVPRVVGEWLFVADR